ncbi:hypothetical protein ABEF95_008605 [Exophiala dermatitidis]
MPRPRPPPTPTSSTDLKAVEKTSQNSDMEAVFALPPPALRSAAEGDFLRRDSKSSTTGASTNTGIGIPPFQTTPPVSPQEKPLSSSPRHKRTASGAIKSQSTATTGEQQAKSNSTQTNGSSYSLPPPPSRARKIIQMKPKSTTTSAASETRDSSYHPPASATATAAASSSTSTAKSSGAATNSKKGGKQPSATSAAGRKIARKTAHSIIERRRRSKMNEEFGVLKDMIPACEGVEMHKLAILQAGIEYVRYLEGCVAQLKAENENKSRLESAPPRQQQQQIDIAEDEPSEDDDEDDAGDEPQSASSFGRRQSGQQRSHWAGKNEWSLRDSRKSSAASRGSTSTSTSSSYPSPYTQPQGSSKRRILPASGSGTTSIAASPLQMPMNSQSAANSSGTPTPTLLSPAFNAIHFSPEDQQGRHGSAQMKPSSGMMTTPVDAVGPLPSTSSSWATVNHQSLSSGPSPNMQPLPSPKAAVHLPLSHSAAARHSVSGTLQLPQTIGADARGRSPGAVSDVSATAEATASAALMMLTNEWRGGGRNASASVRVHPGTDSRDRSKGMSVRDLLSS